MVNTCTLLCRLKASHSKEHANLPGAILEHTSLSGSRYTCPLPLLIIRHITWRWLCPERAYIRVNLLRPQDTQHFLQLSSDFSLFLYWLDRRSANVSADTFRSTAEDASPSHQKQLPIIRTFYTTVTTQPFSRTNHQLSNIIISFSSDLRLTMGI